MYLSLLSYLLFVKPTTAYTSEALADKVEWSNLPGADKLFVNGDVAEFNQFAGYIPIDPSTGKEYFYWFFEAQSSPETAPVSLWTNGGPGCTGLLGLMTEHGPIRPDVNGALYLNPFSWNRVSNMIYIEQPTGVGFSYSNTSSDYTMGDDTAAADMFTFINGWLERFPEYRDNDFHITSESYGGHYMPKLAYYIATHNPSEDSGEPRINFKGFAVGNPFTDAFSNKLGRMEKYFGDQIIPKPEWDQYIGLCGTVALKNKNLAECHTRENAFDDMIGSLNHYALDYPTCVSEQAGWLLLQIGYNYSYEPCETHYAGTYLNREDVKKSIHARTDIHWYACAHRAKYSSSDMDVPMMSYYNKLIDNYDMKVLVFSGDDDAVCSTWSTQYWIWDLGYQVLNKWKLWELSDEVAGYYTTFEKNFAFVTVHSAGHEVPTFQPARALQVFTNYLNGFWFQQQNSNNNVTVSIM